MSLKGNAKTYEQMEQDIRQLPDMTTQTILLCSVEKLRRMEEALHDMQRDIGTMQDTLAKPASARKHPVGGGA